MSSSERQDRPETGVYALVLHVPEVIHGLRVGQLGEFDFAAGYYVYVGSALRGLQSRLRRHLRGSGSRKHWHIDYLAARARTGPALAWGTERDLECALSRRVRALSDGSVEGFGCSDCSCRSHLYYFRSEPVAELGQVELSAGGSDEIGPVRAGGRADG